MIIHYEHEKIRTYFQDETRLSLISNMTAMESLDSFFVAILKSNERYDSIEEQQEWERYLGLMCERGEFFNLLKDYILANDIEIGYTVQTEFERKVHTFIKNNNIETFKDLDQNIFTLMKLAVLK